MKFGKYLKSQEVPGWEFYYLSYNRIKKQLVQKASTSAEALQTQKNFQIAIEKELEKINSYFQLKSDELYDLALQAKQRVKDGDLSKDIDEELDRITDSLIQLDRYQKLNYMGFIKLLKKHDKHSVVEAKQWFMLRVEDSPFMKKDVDHILLQVSDTWKSILSQRNKKVVEERKGGEVGQAQVFERKTTKYWVPISNVLEVKCGIIKHLPIDVFDKSSTRSDNLTTSVYYDSPELVLYHDRLQRNEGAVNLRMRSYGKGTKQPIVFVERKTHHDSWVGESSVKQRFTIKSTKLFDFLHGNYSLEEKLKKAKERKEMSETEIEETRRLSSEIQELVISKNLEPKLTTRYTRTAFQMGRDATVRMSLDTDLHMIKEHGYANNRWGRDLSLPIDENEVTWFPYAILEVKLNLPFGQETPQWITDILEKNKITPIPKFSKFSHGCAVLFTDKCQLLPTWLPLLNTREETIEDKLYSFSTQTDTIVRKSANITTTAKQTTPLLTRDSKMDNSFSINNNNMPVKLEEIKTEIPPVGVKGEQNLSKRPQRSISLLETEDNISLAEEENAPFIIRNRRGGANRESKIKRSIGNFIDKVKGCAPCGGSSKKSQPKPQMPLKVDPKTFFANERTLLHWLSFLIIVQSVGVALMRFSPGYEPWRVGGLIFVAVSLLFMGYAVVRYEQRRIAITNKSKGPYSDRFGPAILVTALLAAVIVNVVLAYKMYFSYACAGKSLLTLNFYQFSPNDVLWHDDMKKLYLVQNDLLSVVNTDDTTNILYPGVHTSLTYASGINSYLYVGNLNPPSIDEYDLNNKVVVRRFYITIPGSNSTNGLNALTFVPDSSNIEGGLFWCGSNIDGSVYTYQLPIKSNLTSTSTKLISQFYPVSGMSNINSLSYHKESNYIWSSIGSWLVKIPTNAPTENAASSSVLLLGFPSIDGITVKGRDENAELFVACNSCNDVWQFPFKNYDPFSSGKCYPTSASDFTGAVKGV